MTSSSEQTTALIAEARTTLAGAVGFIYLRGLAERLADALEAADRALTVDWAEGITAEDESAIRRHMHELAMRNTALSAPRVVSTVAELDALPNDTAIRDSMGDVGVIHGENVWYPETTPIKRAKVAKNYLPATVLWVGGTE